MSVDKPFIRDHSEVPENCLPRAPNLAGPNTNASRDRDSVNSKTEATASVPSPPSRTGRWVRLVPVEPYVEFLYQLSIDESSGFRWRFAGAVPPFGQFQERLWQGVLAQFVVLERRTSAPVGVVVAFNAELQNGLAHFGGVMIEGVRGTGLAIEAFNLFVSYLFATWNLRKLYLEVPEFNLAPMASAIGSLLKEEGRFREHTFYGGRFWDRVWLALYRDEFIHMTRSRLGRRVYQSTR